MIDFVMTLVLIFVNITVIYLVERYIATLRTALIEKGVKEIFSKLDEED